MTTCICTPQTDGYSETFIRAHIHRLPGRIVTVSGTLPAVRYGERQLIPRPLRAMRRICHPRQLSNIVGQSIRQRAAAFLKREKVDVVLAEYGVTATEYTDVCRRARIPLVVHFHGFDISRREVLDDYATEYQELFREAAGMVVVSTAMRTRVEELAGSSERIYYNPYGVDLARFYPVDPSRNPPIFVAVGRFVDKKAPHLTIFAFRELIKDCPSARLVMAGDGPLLDACKEQVRAFGIEDAVELPGSLSHDQVGTLMRKARAFVQHSVTAPSGDSEGMPVAILEAAATALPVVSTLHAGIPDSMVDGQTAYLVNEYDVHGMAAAMLRLAKSPELARRFGQAARQRVAERFSMDRSIQGLADILSIAVRHYDETRGLASRVRC